MVGLLGGEEQIGQAHAQHDQRGDEDGDGAHQLHLTHDGIDVRQQRGGVKAVQQLLDGFDVDIDGQLGGCGG